MNQKKEIEKFAKIFNKKYGVFTYSGEMAIEIALNYINVKNKCVIMPNNVCHRILISVLRCGGIPILINPKNGFIVDKEDVKNIIEKYDNISTIIIVHQFGISVDIKQIKEIIKNKKIQIIEDVAQAWSIDNIGLFSDYVITSFGKSKQLGFGIGGGIFTNYSDIEDILDINFRKSRESTRNLLPYVLPDNIVIRYKKMRKIADKNIFRQIKNAKNLQKIISKKYKNFKYFNINKGVWNRYPIWTEDNDEYIEIIEKFKKYKIKYELPHKKNLNELLILKEYQYYSQPEKYYKKFLILVKVRDLKKGSFFKWKIES